jgi:hypothetical protein
MPMPPRFRRIPVHVVFSTKERRYSWESWHSDQEVDWGSGASNFSPILSGLLILNETRTQGSATALPWVWIGYVKNPERVGFPEIDADAAAVPQNSGARGLLDNRTPIFLEKLAFRSRGRLGIGRIELFSNPFRVAYP